MVHGILGTSNLSADSLISSARIYTAAIFRYIWREELENDGLIIPPYIVSSNVDATSAKLKLHAMRWLKSQDSLERIIPSLKSGQFSSEGMLPAANMLRAPKTKKVLS